MKGFLLVLVVVLALQYFEAEALRNDGANVCQVRKKTLETYVKKEVKFVEVVSYVPCWNPMRRGANRFRCERKNLVRKVVTRLATRPVFVNELGCCEGWQEDGDECTRAICSSPCSWHQRCVAPDVCRNNPVPNHWTLSTSGCSCYFAKWQDCACCVVGGCQCTSSNPYKCVQCGYGDTCGDEHDEEQSLGVDAWTFSTTGCACDGSNRSGDCPCCQNGGCQVEGRCMQCGLRP